MKCIIIKFLVLDLLSIAVNEIVFRYGYKYCCFILIIHFNMIHLCPWCNGYRRRRVQILDETDCISHSTNTLGKGMNPIILPPAMG